MGGFAFDSVWYVVFSFDQVYIKHACDSISMTTWGRVYYTNLMAAVPLLFTIVAHGEHELLREYEWTMPAVVSYALSCAIGTGIAYFAFLARAAISATAFTVVRIHILKLVLVLCYDYGNNLTRIRWGIRAKP